eukprot:gene1933-2197_t
MFTDNCQQESVSKSLFVLVSMILGGLNIMMQTDVTAKSQPVYTIAQLLKFNSYKQRRAESTKQYHRVCQETPVPFYLGLFTYAKMRKKSIIDKLFELGISVSYDRVLALTMKMANHTTSQYHDEKVVCPLNLRLNLFKTAAVDNIDHNLSSITAITSFHGTRILLFQQPTTSAQGIDCRKGFEQNSESREKRMHPLPEFYTTVTPATLKKGDMFVPKTTGHLRDTGPKICDKETKWPEHMKHSCLQETTSERNVTWGASHASQTEMMKFDMPPISVMLPLFQDDSKSVTMIRHSMNVTKMAVQHLNQGQVPVITYDQPLFALVKSIQWQWPDTYGEQKFVIVLDDSLIKVSHVARTKQAHQITASALALLLHEAYEMYKTTAPQDHESIETWIDRKKRESPQFQYWHVAFQLEVLVLSFVRSLISAIDQGHEQNNAIAKGDGGAVGLFQNEDALTKWMVNGPKIARVLAEFDASSCTIIRQEDMRHYDQFEGIQKDFVKKVKSLTATITDMGNPFLEESNDLLRLDNRDILGEDAHGKLRSCKKADLLECLDNCGESRIEPPPADAVILDGAVIVNMIRPANAKTFDDYRGEAWKNWQQFLRNDENTGELFRFLAKHATQIETTKHVITTYGEDVISVLPRDLSFLTPCNREEADYGMILHAGDAARCGFSRIAIRTVDTDVVVLAVSSVRLLNVTELWLAFAQESICVSFLLTKLLIRLDHKDRRHFQCFIRSQDVTLSLVSQLLVKRKLGKHGNHSMMSPKH